MASAAGAAAVNRAVAFRATILCGTALLTACGSPAAPSRPAAVAASTPAASAAVPSPRPPARVPAPSVSPAPRDQSGRPAAPATGGATARRGAPGDTDPPLPSGLPSSAPLRVALGARCVVPGGEQRLVVETLPDAFVAFDNLYPDQRTGAVHGGAESQARAGADGRFTAVWRVAPGTPTGRVRVDVGVSARSGSAITMTYYRLAARC